MAHGDLSLQDSPSPIRLKQRESAAVTLRRPAAGEEGLEPEEDNVVGGRKNQRAKEADPNKKRWQKF